MQPTLPSAPWRPPAREEHRGFALRHASSKPVGVPRIWQAASLRQMLDSSDKMRGRAEELQTRMAELQLLVKSTYPKYEAAVAAIKAAKADLEAALSSRLDGRRVNLMGDINQL